MKERYNSQRKMMTDQLKNQVHHPCLKEIIRQLVTYSIVQCSRSSWLNYQNHSNLNVFTGRANHWSALIGASHSRSYVLWEYGGYASEGVRQVAEFGSPIKMEEEIRRKVGLTSDEASLSLHFDGAKLIPCLSYVLRPSLWTITKGQW